MVNSEFLVTFCIPFLRDFEVIKRYLTDDINSIKEDFKSCAKSIDMYNKVINNMLPKLSDDTIKSLNYFMYNFTRFVSQCFAYVSFMAIRKINAYMYNVNAINNLYSELMDYYSGGEAILHESVMDGSFDDIDEAGLVNDMVYGNASTLVSIADSIYRKLRTDYANINSDRDSLSTLDIETSSPLDSTVYDEIINTFSVINKSLDALKENIKDPSMIFDDALVKAGLDTRLTDRYKIFICTIPKANVPDLDKSKDSDKKYDLFSMMNEFAHASNMCKKVANAINDSYNKFKLVRSHLNENVDPIPDKCMSIEISDYMDSFDVQFRDLVLSISTSLIQRFQIMKDLCETLMAPDVIHLNYAESMDEIELLSEGEIQKIDFLEEAYNDIIATNNTFNAIIFEEKVNDFNRMRKNQHLRDVLGPLYEADENQNNQSVEVNDQSGSNPQAQAQNDAAADKIQKSNDNGTTSGNPDTEASKFNFGNFLDKIKNFFDTIMKKFSDSISKVSESNKDFIANNKEALLARSYDNITLKMANYGNLKENIYTTDLTKFKNALNSLNSETIANGNADEIANQLLSFVPQVSSIANKSKGLTNYYKTGKASEKDIQMMEFKNAKLRDEVSKMITFCEGFYNGGYAQIVNQIKDIKDTLSSKLNAISTDTTENPSAKTGCNAVANTTRIFTAALLNCYRDRANDNIRALKKLVPKPVLMLVQEVAQDSRNTQLISQFNDCKRRKEIKMYQLIKSIFQKYTHNKIISTDDFNDDIKEAQESFNEIEQTSNQVIINKDILIAFCCFGKFQYTNKEDLNKIIEYLKKIIDIPTNQTTIIWLCQFELRRQLLSYLSEYNLMFDNDATYLDIERELLKSIASDQSNFEQVKTIYGIKER